MTWSSSPPTPHRGGSRTSPCTSAMDRSSSLRIHQARCASSRSLIGAMNTSPPGATSPPGLRSCPWCRWWQFGLREDGRARSVSGRHAVERRTRRGDRGPTIPFVVQPRLGGRVLIGDQAQLRGGAVPADDEQARRYPGAGRSMRVPGRVTACARRHDGASSRRRDRPPVGRNTTSRREIPRTPRDRCAPARAPRARSASPASASSRAWPGSLSTARS